MICFGGVAKFFVGHCSIDIFWVALSCLGGVANVFSSHRDFLDLFRLAFLIVGHCSIYVSLL